MKWGPRSLLTRLSAAARDRAYQFAVLGGVAGALSFDPLALRFLIPLAPLSCFLAVRRAAAPGAAFRRALAFGWVFYFGALHWLCTLSVFNPIAPLGIAALALYVAFYVAIPAYLLRRWFWNVSPSMQFALFASLWLFGEWARTLGRLAMPLAQLGHAWAPVPSLIQVAGVLGELGVSAMVLAMAGLCYFWACRLLARLRGQRAAPVETNPRPAGIAVASLITLCVIIILGFSRRAANDAEPQVDRGALNVALLQPNIDQMTKLASYAYPDEAVQRDLQNRMARLQEDMVAEHAVNDWDLLILPESSFTEPDIASNPVVRERISGLARAAGCDMLVGGNRDLSTEARSEVYNSSFLVHGDGQWDAAHYDKMRLVPFGESLPYFDMIPGFQEHVVGIGSFNEGRSQTIFTTRGRGGEKSPVAFGVLICFESTFSSLARGLARAGAEFLVVQTNDAWYGLSAGAAQHHHLSQLRAVETGRWVLRCANTGISSIIAPSGRLVASLPLGRRGLLRHAIGLPENPAATPYCLIGNFWLSAPALLLLAGLALSVRNARRELLR